MLEELIKNSIDSERLHLISDLCKNMKDDRLKAVAEFKRQILNDDSRQHGRADCNTQGMYWEHFMKRRCLYVDLNPLDFFFWGFLKSLLYAGGY
ncbi:hypothetical protein TNCV_4072061 [Trichonephila clavipes]|uniref:Uncharacterized protein n=1 Tax=Trichonephila clavipes TaxID=2585209 RepID=A0A8X6W7V8_TRICX|nr:hypothetical protein TNCV_4072061 [Trichonephila clavipes]